MRGLRHRTLDIELERRFGGARPQFGHPPPATIT
jgi:hypothetical protein